jgi:hypothetical protein
MKRLGLIAVLAMMVVGLSALAASATTTINPAAAPTGTHVQTGTPSCTVNSDLTVTCSAYELAGVGNTNAADLLTVSYSATVRCRNHGGNIVDVKTQPVSTSAGDNNLAPKNGRLTVPRLDSAPVPTDSAFEAQATCPNGNWTKELLAGSVTLNSFTYTLTFDGFSGAYITITGP